MLRRLLDTATSIFAVLFTFFNEEAGKMVGKDEISEGQVREMTG